MNNPIHALTLKQLRYLVAVADHLHFGQAAEACGVTQPSLSEQIAQLEQILGQTLIERTRRRVLVTPAGLEAVARARRILRETHDLIESARRGAAPLEGELRLGVIPTLGPYLLPRVLPALRRAFPALRLYLREDQTDRLLDRLRTGDLDALLLALPTDAPSLTEIPIFDEPFLVALPADHPLASRAELSESDLRDERLLLLEDGHCLRDQALTVCQMVGVRELESFAATSLDTLREMVASGIGVTLLPALACTAASTAEQVALRPFKAPAPSRRMGLVWRRGAPRGEEYRLLAAFIRDRLPPGAVPVGASKDAPAPATISANPAPGA